MTQLSFDFDPLPTAQLTADSNDYHRLPASEKQLNYARKIAERRRLTLPDAVLGDRKALSDWIDRNKDMATSRFGNYPSSKQVAFAERLARMKRRAVPDACFKDRTLMSRWIDTHR